MHTLDVANKIWPVLVAICSMLVISGNVNSCHCLAMTLASLSRGSTTLYGILRWMIVILVRRCLAIKALYERLRPLDVEVVDRKIGWW